MASEKGNLESSESRNLIRLASIEMSGLSGEASAQLDAFIRALVACTDDLDRDLALPMPIALRVLVTPEFESAVDRIRNEYGIQTTGAYRATRKAVMAVGITLHKQDGMAAEFTIVLNSHSCCAESAESTVNLHYLIAHEFGHVLIDSQYLGLEKPRDLNMATNVAESISNMAEILRDELKADRIASCACGLILRLADGSPVLLSGIIGPPMVDSAATLLRELHDFAFFGVQMYRITAQGLHALKPRADALISELLLVLTHLVALYDSNPVGLFETLARIPGFATYVQEEWQRFVVALNAETYDELHGKMTGVYANILATLGLRIEEQPNGGLYIHVSEPRFCSEFDGT